MKRNDRTALSAFLRILPWIVTLLAAAAVGYYILFPGWGYFHSDCTDTILWAQASYDAGALFNPDFEYACLLPFGGQLLMLPFIACSASPPPPTPSVCCSFSCCSRPPSFCWGGR